MIIYVLVIIIAIFLIGAILLQMQGSGLSSAFGGEGQLYRSKQSLDKLLIWATVILAALFAALSIILLIPR